MVGFRGGNVAAPLKPFGSIASRPATPRFRGGNVAAPLKLGRSPCRTLSLRRFPRRQRRGSVEARGILRPKFGVPRRFRGGNVAAPLKHFVLAQEFQRSFGFRGGNVAAPLKPDVARFTVAEGVEFPRRQRRGSVEASQARVPAPAQAMRFPRRQRRGSVEAFTLKNLEHALCEVSAAATSRLR